MPDELTKSQSIFVPVAGGTGLNYTYGLAYKGDNGVTFLPQDAAVRGSGAYEGRNPYDHSGQFGVFGWGSPGISDTYLPGSWHNYRLMRANPTLALVRACVFGPILAAGWTVEVVDDSVPEEAKEVIERVFNCHRVPLLSTLLRALDYGYQACEVVWGEDADGYKVPVKFKGLLPDLNTLVIDKSGNLIAIDNQGVRLPIDRALVYTYDREGDNHYGRSRHENCRRVWSNYLTSEDKLSKLEGKAAGTFFKVGYPPDKKNLAAGEKTNQQIAREIVIALSNGQSITYPTTGGVVVDDIEQAVAISKGTLFPIELMNAGDTGAAQSAVIEGLHYKDQQLVRGWGRSERSVIEATGGGTRAESANHTANISDTDTDTVHEDIVRSINEQVVDAILIENFGPKAKGAVRLKAIEIVDENQAVDSAVLNGVINNPMAFGEFLSRFDKTAFCERQGIKLMDDHEPWPEEMPTSEAPDPLPGDEGEGRPNQRPEDE